MGASRKKKSERSQYNYDSFFFKQEGTSINMLTVLDNYVCGCKKKDKTVKMFGVCFFTIYFSTVCLLPSLGFTI